ncbi:MAG: hypothetical protein WCO23_00435 [bacterium]
MTKLYRNLCFLAFAILVSLFLPHKASAAYEVNNFSSDSIFVAKNSMSAEEINNFLKSHNSVFADYIIPETVQVPYPTLDDIKFVTVRQFNEATHSALYGKTVAQLIYDECQEHNINPQVILTIMEKESSAITMNRDAFLSKKNRLAWPLFYMYDETMGECLNYGTSCNHETYFQEIASGFGGVGQQIAYATAYFGKLMGEYTNGGRCLHNSSSSTCTSYELYNEPIKLDGQTVSCQSASCRILYLYTPHISSSQSFFNIFARWWNEPNTGQSISSFPKTTVITGNTSNDFAQYVVDTYEDNVIIKGTKTGQSIAYFNDNEIAGLNGMDWQITVTPSFGESTYFIEFKDASGSLLGRKPILVRKKTFADINGDGVVDMKDLSIFAENWGRIDPDNTLTNLNPDTDEEVNVLDLSILSANWKWK